MYATEDPDASLPRLNSMEDWVAIKSTKLDAFAQICSHYLARDDVDQVSFVDGELVVPPIPADSAKVYTRTRRVCAYIEFVRYKPLIEQVSMSICERLAIDMYCLGSAALWYRIPLA